MKHVVGEHGVVAIIQEAPKLPDPPCTEKDNPKTHMDGKFIHTPGLRTQFHHLCIMRLVTRLAWRPKNAEIVELTPEAADKFAKKMIRIFAKQSDTTSADVKEYSEWIRPSADAVFLLTEPLLNYSTDTPWKKS